MSKHLGNLTVTTANAHSFPAVDEIYGHLTIAAGAELRAPRLTLVRGWLTIETGAIFTAPMLGLVDGWLAVAGQFSAIHLVEVRQDMVLSDGSIIDLPALTTVTNLVLQRNTAKNLVALTEVRESVSLGADAGLTAALLERIGKSITLREGARLDAPALNYIGGYADIDESAILSAPRFIGG